jgi:PKD repeat protein
MGRRIILIIGAAALLAGLLLAVTACENPLLGTVQQIYTSFHSKLVQANFSSNNATQYFDPGVGNITVSFTDQSIGEITAYDWDFGDAGSSTLPNPSHTYYDEGYYTVSLTVSGPEGSSTETKENFVAAYSATPLVDIYMPNDGSWVTGTVSVQANADFPPEPIINVQFFVNDALAATDTTAPYAYSWDTSGQTQNVLIPLKAIANTGSVAGTDDDTAVKVDNTPPVTTLTAPAGGAVSGDVTLTATLSDSYSLPNRVEFYVDGSRRSTDYTPAYGYTWNARFYSEGSSHTLLARGFDNVGLYTNDSTNVTIDNVGAYNPANMDSRRIDGINNRISVDAKYDSGFKDVVVVVAYEDTSEGNIYLTVSTDGGASFGERLLVPKAKPPASNPAVAYDPVTRDIFLAFLQDTDGGGYKDIVMLRSANYGADWELYWFSDNPDPTSLALDVRGGTLGLLFDARGRDLYLACTKDLGTPPGDKPPRIASYAYARDLSLTAYGGIGYCSWVNRSDELMFVPADLGNGDLLKEVQRLATDVRGYSSTAVDPGGKTVGVAFIDRYANPMMLLADRVELKFNPVERIADYGDCGYIALTLGEESIRLAFASAKYGLRLAASQVGKNWISYPVDDKYAFLYVSMAADGERRQHIGYYDLDNRREKFVTVPFNW